MPNREIFVDDIDSSITYGGGWSLETFDPSNFTELPTFPFYGTLHLLSHSDSKSVNSGNISFTFNGSTVSSFFVPNTPTEAIIYCQVDGQNQTIQTTDGGEVRCEAEGLQEGLHELFIEVEAPISSSILFDALRYMPSGRNTSAGDVIFFSGDSSVKISASENFVIEPGGTLDFDFFGYSLALYGQFSDSGSHNPSNISYALDGQTPINFTIENVATVANNILAPVLVLQTPRYPFGPHHFHLKFLGTDETVPLTFDEIIVQNTTSARTPEPFPAIPSTGIQASPSLPSLPPPPSFVSSRPKSSHLGVALGVAAAAVAIGIFAFGGFIYFRRRRRSLDEVLVRPFMRRPNRRRRADPSELEDKRARGRRAAGMEMSIDLLANGTNHRSADLTSASDQRTGFHTGDSEVESPPEYSLSSTSYHRTAK